MMVLLRSGLELIRSSLWFVPATLITLSIALAAFTVWVDSVVISGHGGKWVFFSGGSAGARAVLSTIAGSMITVAGVTFSITIVALTLASSQFGPRLLRNFMRDRFNQFVLGTFLGTFVYCLLTLGAAGGTYDGSFVPHLSVIAGILLAILSLSVFVLFIHHVSISIQPEWVIASVRAEFNSVCASLFPESVQDTATPAPTSDEARALAWFEKEGQPIVASRSGYVVAVDMKSMLSASSNADIVVKMLHRPGDFVIEGAPLLIARPAAHVTDEATSALRNLYIVRDQRTPLKDVEFAIEQLVEIALRALSTGINDPFTAISCVDYLGAQIALLAGREFPVRFWYDESGTLRVIADVLTFASVVDTAFNQIRQHALTNVSVLIRILEAIGNVTLAVKRASDVEVLRHHTELVYTVGKANIPEESDLDDLQTQYRKTLDLLGY